MYKDFVKFVHELYGTDDFIPLHEPRFIGNEKKYLLDTIDSTFVSSVGAYVDRFESQVAKYTDIKYAVATVNGTSALHIALLLADVEKNDEVITQSLTFVATCNAISYCGAVPIFVDVDRTTLGLSADSLETFLLEHAEVRDDGYCWNKSTGNRIKACVPMNTFGHPVSIDKLKKVCETYNIFLVEDAAESLGSFTNGVHTGKKSDCAILSFNGNKIVTAGGGGMILTDNESLALKAKHLTTTAKMTHKWNFEHDSVGYNYRMPNLNAALGVAQVEELPNFIKQKRELASTYQDWCKQNDLNMIIEPKAAKSNYWLNAIVLENISQRNDFLEYTNTNNVMSRPVWTPMHKLAMYDNCFKHELNNTEYFENRVVNIPSSVIVNG